MVVQIAVYGERILASQGCRSADDRRAPLCRPGGLDGARAYPIVRRPLPSNQPAKRGSGTPRVPRPVIANSEPRSTGSPGKRGRGGLAIEVI